MQLISIPMAPDSRGLKPNAFAVKPQERNLEKNATTHINIVYPQVRPVSKVPKSVRRPERAKYWNEEISRCVVEYVIQVRVHLREEQEPNEVFKFFNERDVKFVLLRDDEARQKPS